MEQIDFSKVPYGQYFRESAAMFGSAQIQSVFNYLMSEHTMCMRQNLPPEVKVSCNALEPRCGVHRHTIKKILQQLENVMRLISIKSNKAKIDMDLYVSLIYAYHKLSSEKRPDFTAALNAGDYEKLKSLGFERIVQISTNLLSLKGKVVENYTTSDIDDKSCTNFDNQSSEVVQISTVSDKDKRDCTNFDNEQQKVVEICTTSLKRLDKVVEICTTVIGEFQQSCTNFDNSADIIEAFEECFGEELEEGAVQETISAILYKKCQLLPENELSKFIQLFSKLLYKFIQPLVEICTTENNIENKEKNNTTDEDENERFFTFGKVDANLLERAEKEPPVIHHRKRTGRSMFQKVDYPYYPEHEILEFISDIHLCTDDGAKLFLYNFNQEIHARYDRDEIVDEETGDVIIEATTDYHQFAIYKSDFKRMLGNALDDTQEAIDNGYVYVENEKVEVTATMEHPEILIQIFDWRFMLANDGDEMCSVDWGKVQNPTAEPLEDIHESLRPVRTPAGEVNVELENDRYYLRRILELGNDDNTYKQLTPMELLIYNFTIQFYTLNEEGNAIEDFGERRTLNRNVLARFFMEERQARENTPSPEDFYACCNKAQVGQYGELSLRISMYSSKKIVRWNAKHCLQSVIFIEDRETTV